MNKSKINEVIRNRRSIYPHQFNQKKISEEIISILLENANLAPTHKLTQPWRFKVIRGKAKNQLGKFLSDVYSKENLIKKNIDYKLKKIRKKCKDSSVILMICMSRDPKKSVPEWEEIASTAMSVQNIWLSCSQFGIGCYWSSPSSINKIDRFTHLNKGERCLGFLYMGYYNHNENIDFKRQSIEEKVEWINNFNI